LATRQGGNGFNLPYFFTTARTYVQTLSWLPWVAGLFILGAVALAMVTFVLPQVKQNWMLRVSPG
jgi:hypothetical protein